ncbi:MAG: phosphoribosylamine--glycine ligase [Candidatus Dormibacteraeota bacterium]|uniref:Phosphoribosylamine--glycine ligase n=1 Tax=Candidatus Amunia macphersoniae TaxID=3127014 RepID=A0A934KEK6_9BACT|nr:phosphoribosylamine--glycine ligase [Candidatus Dormibacteraeota bacterium]
MRVLVAGSGAREHALAWACRRGGDQVEIICAPGNGGTAGFATNVPVAADDPAGMVRAAREHDVALVIVGPDAALAAGVADACMAAGIAVFGPTAAAARIESSKTFAKLVMDRAGIPTARWRAGTVAQRHALLGFVEELEGRCVVKADGLALGKGVLVCDDVSAARAAIGACIDEQRFGSAGDTVLVEERLEGPEVSVLALTDSRRLRLFPAARDYKRIGDGDTGPNTGGMGAVTPPAGVDDALLARVEGDVLRPCIDTLAAAGTPFSGCLYAGLMLTADGPRVLEFNARFGDPETQVLLPVLGEDVLALLLDCAHGDLAAGRVARRAQSSAVGVVLAAAGYPASPRRGDLIEGLEGLGPSSAADGDVLAFHAGTRRHPDGTLRTEGGRVVTLVARGERTEEAREHVYGAVGRISFAGMQHRTDIGRGQDAGSNIAGNDSTATASNTTG